MLAEFIVGFVIGYAITPLIRLHVILHENKMYEQTDLDEDFTES